MQIHVLLWWLLFKDLTERYRDDEQKLAVINWFQVNSPAILTCGGVLPLFLIMLCYLSSLGCGYSESRHRMEQWGMCSSIKDFGTLSPWYLDLWNSQASNPRPEPPAQYIRKILVSPLLLEDAQIALHYYIEEMESLCPGIIEEMGLSISLSKSHVFEYSV